MLGQDWVGLPETVAVDALADVNVTINRVKWGDEGRRRCGEGRGTRSLMWESN